MLCELRIVCGALWNLGCGLCVVCFVLFVDFWWLFVAYFVMLFFFSCFFVSGVCRSLFAVRSLVFVVC